MNTTDDFLPPVVAAATPVPGHPGYVVTTRRWAARSFSILTHNGTEVARGSLSDVLRSLPKEA